MATASHRSRTLPRGCRALSPLRGALVPSHRPPEARSTPAEGAEAARPAQGPGSPCVMADSLRSRTRPSRRCPRSRALQSQRCRRNWCWHSAVQAATPRPMESMASGCRRHSCRCRLTRPGTLSHITREEPTAPMYLRREGAGQHRGPRHREPPCTDSERRTAPRSLPLAGPELQLPLPFW